MVERYSKSIARRQLGTLPKVTPKDARVNTYEAQAWGQVAQTGAALSTQFGQYARDHARTQAINDAEGVVLEKDSTGLTIMPPPMQEGGTIYQENYKRTVGNIYKREIKTDIEGSMSRLYAKHFLEPDVMSVAMEDSLNSIIENVAPQNQQEMANIGRERINIFEQRAVEKATTKAFNTNINSLNQEREDITDRLISNDLDISERDDLVSRAVEIDLDLAGQGLMTPYQIEQGKRNREDYENYFILRDLTGARGSSESAVLLNDPSKLIGMAQLLEGNEGGANNVGVTLTDGLKDYKFTRDSIEDLIQNPTLRKKIAAQFRARASDLVDKNTQSEKSMRVQGISEWWAKGNPGTPLDAKDVDVQDAYNLELKNTIEKVSTESGEKVEFSSFIRDIGDLNDNKHLKYVAGIVQYIGQREAIPDSILNGLKDIALATPSELANFYFPFYKQMQSTNKLQQVWRDSGLGVSKSTMFKRMERLVETSNDPSKNKSSFENLAILLKASNNEKIINKFKSLLLKDEDNAPKSIDLNSGTLVMEFLDQFYAQELSEVSYSEYNKEMKALAYRETLEYISEGDEHNIKDLTDELIKLSDRVVKNRADPQEISGGYPQKDFNQMLYDSRNDKDQVTDLSSKYKEISINGKAFKADPKYTIMNVKLAEAVNNRIKNSDVDISVLDDDSMYRTIGELYKSTVFSNINQNQKLEARGGEFNRSIKEPAFKNKEQQQAYRNNQTGVAIDGELPVKRSMYAPFTIDYKNKEIPMIFGVTYKLHYDETTEKTHVVLIDDDGEFRTINGYLEIDGEAFVFDTKSIIEENASQIKSIKNIKALNLLIEKEKTFIEQEKELTSNPSGNFQVAKSKPFPTVGLGKKIVRHFFPKNEEERIRISESQIVGYENEKEKEIDFLGYEETLDNIEEIKNDPIKYPLIKDNGTGKDLTMNVASVVAKMLPAGNEENVKNYLFEIANVESDAGTHKDTYVGKNKDMGIWQNYKALTSIQSYIEDNSRGEQFASNVKIIERAMQEEYMPKFSVANLTIENLKSPLVSAVVARLYIALTEDPIPNNMYDRADYWKRHYNTESGLGTIEAYRSKNSVLMVE